MNMRLFVKSYIESRTDKPYAIILGSSRLMQIGNHNYHNNVMNFSVSSASVQDYLAFWFLASKKFDPKIIFIGVDPWLFNDTSLVYEDYPLESEYISSLENLGFDLNFLYPIHKNTKDNVASSPIYKLYNSVNKPLRIKADDDSPDYLIDKIRNDGSRVYNLSFANKPTAEIELNHLSFINYGMFPYKRSDSLKKVFKEFILHLKKDHEVILVLSPYYSKTYEAMISNNKIFIGIEQEFIDLSLATGVHIIGSYDPRKIGCLDSEFFDGMHPKDECMKRVFYLLNRDLPA